MERPSAFRLIFTRLLERRLLGDGEAVASSTGGALATLTLSLMVFALVAAERPSADVALFLVFATFVWTAVRAFLESREVGFAAVDRAILEPLPLRRGVLPAARALTVFAVLAISTLNLALPPVALVLYLDGPLAAGLLLAAAFLAALAGLAAAAALRALGERTIGLRRLEEWEGPIRLGVGIALFSLLFAAPNPSALIEQYPALGRLPPLSFAALPHPGAPLPSRAAALLGALGALLLLGLALAAAARGDGRLVERGSATGAALPRRLFARWFVRAGERAAFDFALVNMARDRAFRARVYPLFAFPFAVVALVAVKPQEPFLALMALYGTAVYLVLAQTFQAFSESAGGPELLRGLPLRDVAAFRIGGEKAFLLGLVLPVHLALGLALALLACFGRGLPLQDSLGHALTAFLFVVLQCAVGFERVARPAFSEQDRGVYPGDLGGAAFTALLLSALMAVIALKTVRAPLPFAVQALALATMIRFAYAWKRRRWTADPRSRREPTAAPSARR